MSFRRWPAATFVQPALTAALSCFRTLMSSSFFRRGAIMVTRHRRPGSAPSSLASLRSSQGGVVGAGAPHLPRRRGGLAATALGSDHLGMGGLTSHYLSTDIASQPRKFIPLPDDVHSLPHDFAQLPNETLFHLAKGHVHGACRERLVREIMRVDTVDWEHAMAKVEEMNQENDKGGWLVTFPYKIGFSAGLVAAATSIPLVFDLETVQWFNDAFVHEDIPEGGWESLDNIWKVGSFSWGYMEPLMGTLSFMLLGMQFARAQLQRMNLKPYTELLLSYRANRLAGLYPAYDRSIVREYSKSDPWSE